MQKYIATFVLVLFLLLPVSVIHAETLQIGDTTIVTDGYITTTQQYQSHLYLGGNISTVTVNTNSPVTRNNIAEITIENQTVTDWNPQVDGPVHDIVSYTDKLFIAGQFEQFDTTAQKYFIAVQQNTKEPVEPYITINQPVYALALHQDILYLGGAFIQINGDPRGSLASYNLVDNSLSLWAPDVNDTVYDILIYENTMYIGGAFTRIDNQERSHIAAFNLVDGSLADWSPQTDLIITHIEYQNEQIVATGFSLLGQEVMAKRLTLDPVTGTITSEEEVIIDPSIPIVLYPQRQSGDLIIDEEALGFKIPTLSNILTFVIRAFFVIAGLAALFYMLLGALAWVTSGGDSDAVSAAQGKIQAAVVGMLIIVAVLALVWTLEQVVFNQAICLGLSCPITIPTLLTPAV